MRIELRAPIIERHVTAESHSGMRWMLAVLAGLVVLLFAFTL
ncbi:MAG TPA: hypothetical protein VMI56_11760 [Reyranella sp.]|nr:hypothetical protein [Reyranella sp.]